MTSRGLGPEPRAPASSTSRRKPAPHDYPRAYNAGLAKGYAESRALTAAEKKEIRDVQTQHLIADRSAKFMEAWSNSDWIFNYARVFAKNHIR